MAIALPFLTAACAGPPAELNHDVEAYLRQLRIWAPTEAEAARSIDRILQTHFVDESAVRHEIADLRPRIARHLTTVEAYVPRTDQVASLHATYVASWDGLLRAYDAIEAGLDSGRAADLARGRRALSSWRASIREVATALKDLRAEVGA